MKDLSVKNDVRRDLRDAKEYAPVGFSGPDGQNACLCAKCNSCQRCQKCSCRGPEVK